MFRATATDEVDRLTISRQLEPMFWGGIGELGIWGVGV